MTCRRTESERILIITKDDTLVCMAYKSVLLYVTIQSLVEAVLRMEFWIVTV